MKKCLIISICILMCSITGFAMSDYTDIQNGTKFTLPEHWNQIESSMFDEYYYAGFVRENSDRHCIITYNRIDIWSTLSDEEKKIIPRRKFNNNVTSKKEISEIIKVPEYDIHIVSYGGKEYYAGSRMSAILYDGTAIATPDMLYLIHIENGWMYQFQYSGGQYDEYYNEVEKMLESVRYPKLNESGLETNTSVIVMMLPFVVVIIVTLFIILLVFKIDKKKREKMCSVIEDSDVSFNLEIKNSQFLKNEHFTCKNCGQLLPLNSKFCHKCGAKVIKGEQ